LPRWNDLRDLQLRHLWQLAGFPLRRPLRVGVARQFKGASNMSVATQSPARAGRIATLGVDHVAFNVPDLEAALSFFTVAFGCEVVSRNGRVDYGNGLSVTAALIRYGGATQFELLEWRGPGARQEMAGLHDLGGGHLAFAVADLDASLAGAASLLRVSAPATRELPDGRRAVWFPTPWGMTIQLLTRLPAARGNGAANGGG
jgi:catechol 2,3-dioxygenase-like lactoylglutathione lyase family enzyme